MTKNAPVEKEENETPKPETPKPDTPKPDTKPENPKEETPKKDDKTSSSTIEKPEENNTTDESLEAVVPRHVEVYWRGEKIVDKDYSLEEVKEAQRTTYLQRCKGSCKNERAEQKRITLP